MMLVKFLIRKRKDILSQLTSQCVALRSVYTETRYPKKYTATRISQILEGNGVS